MSLLEIARRARETGAAGPLIAYAPYARWLGLEARVVEERLIFTLPGRDDLIGNPKLKAIHGGVIAGYLEAVMQLELIWRLEALSVPKTVTVTVDYLRSARMQPTFAMASVTKQGRRASAVHVTAWQEDETKPVAQAHGHFLTTR